MGHRIAIANSDAEIASCFDVMSELRPHLARDDFVPTVRRLEDVAGFRLAALTAEGSVRAVAGFRVSEWLPGGRYLEIEDLVTTEPDRSKGYGGQLFEWLVEHARAEGCAHLRLLSAIAREDAHRFYERKGMTKDAYYFNVDL